jgi:hypothetical protein
MRHLLKKAEFKRRFIIAGDIERWATTMTKVGIRQAVARTPWPRWHFVNFCGPKGGESRGIVDMIAIRKHHGVPHSGLKRGDALQIVLIQIKGGHAAKPTAEDRRRLHIVARRHGACAVLLATWKKGKAARFFLLHPNPRHDAGGWAEVADLRTIFH